MVMSEGARCGPVAPERVCVQSAQTPHCPSPSCRATSFPRVPRLSPCPPMVPRGLRPLTRCSGSLTPAGWATLSQYWPRLPPLAILVLNCMTVKGRVLTLHSA